MSTQEGSRLDELLAGRALGDLSDEEVAELDALLEQSPGADAESFERALAAVDLIAIEKLDELPQGLAAKIGKDAERAFPPRKAMESNVVAMARPTAARSRGSWVGWAVAASFALLAASAWIDRARHGSGPDGAPSALPANVATAKNCPSASAPPPPSSAAPSSSSSVGAAPLLADARVVPWSATKDAAAKGASGEVKWSARSQEGTMHIRGLAKNDPHVSQYQLWIFDAERDERYPVDGGVFDITGDDVVVPITPKVAAKKAKLFAITIEPPGGVVVSKREHIVLTAAM